MPSRHRVSARLIVHCKTWRPPAADADARSLLVDALGSFLSLQGPLPLEVFEKRLGPRRDRLEPALEELVESGRVVADLIRDEATETEYCDTENLERLLRLLRTSHRKPFAARPMAEFPLLLATFQGIARRGSTH